MIIQNATLVCFVDSGDCAAQGISGASDLDVSRTEPAGVGPVLASEYSFHDCSCCSASYWGFCDLYLRICPLC